MDLALSRTLTAIQYHLSLVTDSEAESSHHTKGSAPRE
jgi:hypothetical protein